MKGYLGCVRNLFKLQTLFSHNEDMSNKYGSSYLTKVLILIYSVGHSDLQDLDLLDLKESIQNTPFIFKHFYFKHSTTICNREATKTMNFCASSILAIADRIAKIASISYEYPFPPFRIPTKNITMFLGFMITCT